MRVDILALTINKHNLSVKKIQVKNVSSLPPKKVGILNIFTKFVVVKFFFLPVVVVSSLALQLEHHGASVQLSRLVLLIGSLSVSGTAEVNVSQTDGTAYSLKGVEL